MDTWLMGMDLWDIMEKGYEEPKDQSSLKSEEKCLKKEEQHTNYLALMALRKGIK